MHVNIIYYINYIVSYKIQDSMIRSKYKVGIAILNGIIRKSLVERVIFEQIFEESEGVSHVVCIANAKTLMY